MVELNEAHAALHEPAGQQAVVGERFRPWLGAVEIERSLRFGGEINQLRTAGLHAVSHLIGRDAGGDFGVSNVGQVCQVEIADSPDRFTLALMTEPRGTRKI